MRLQGKVAVVTGAGRGIGQAIATRFAAEGAAVVCADIDAASATATGTQITQAGGRAVAVNMDVADADANQRVVADAEASFGGLDILCVNAAIQQMGNLEDTEPEQWDRLHAVNLRGAYLGIRAALPAMRRRGGGSVIITASLLGIVGDPDMPAYGASKGGLRALCRSIAAAHGIEQIRVNCICPGDVDTQLLQDFFAHQPDPEQAKARIVERYPLRRFATPSDIANAALFLASDESGYITGTDLVIDGGLLARIY